MSKVKNSSPLNQSTRSKAKGSGTGCVVVAGLLLVGLMLAVIVAGLGLSGFFGNGQTAAGISGLSDPLPPETVQARREKDQARLNSYGWIDKESGVVRIPIEQAMAVVAESGLPVGIPTATVTPTPPAELAAGETTQAESTPTPPPTPTVDLANVSFTANVLPIFEQHCTECHGGDEPEEGLRLTSYDEIMAGSWNGPVIEPGNVPDSYLIEQVVTGRMPKRGSRLSPAEIQIITAWVEAGAPDN